jgi:ribonuclease P protein component
VKTNAFPKRLRVLGNDEFKAVIAKRRRFGDNLMVLYIAPNGREYARLGVSISSAVGGAALRNRFKRLVREVFRLNRGQIAAGFDYVVTASAELTKKLIFEQVKESFLKLAQEAIKKNAKQ